MNKNLKLLDHPLLSHKITILRRKETNTAEFRQTCREISLLMGYEILRSIPLKEETVQTPLETIKAPVIDGRKPALVAVLRAGLVMMDGLLDLIPSARVGHIGMFRNPKTLLPESYYCKLPSPSGRLFIVCDPMLATGGTAKSAIKQLIEYGVDPMNIRFACFLACPEGVKNLSDEYPNIPIYTAALDRELNDKGYILPGLGDAGDRVFGTK